MKCNECNRVQLKEGSVSLPYKLRLPSLLEGEM
ncbi:tetracycline resistance efflux system leader peptide [Enterococcus faecalis]